MPTYVYKFVDSGETIEVQQAFHDDTLTEYAHPESGDVLPVKKVFTPVGVTFKGSGFFKTDNRGKTSSTSASGSASGSASSSKTDSGTSTSDSTTTSTSSGSSSDSTGSSSSGASPSD